ncbi:MAG: hypothetical protein ACFB00_02090 [Parvularculaceae bacterium]
MLLRKISKHLAAQNWLAVALDFFIVIIGVFIGLQLSNWNEARANRASEARYLRELSADLSADLKEIRAGFRSTELRLAISAKILQQAQPAYAVPVGAQGASADLDLPERFENRALAALVSTSFVTGQDHTFDELVQSGNLGVLSDRRLSKRLSEYYTALDSNRIGDEVIREQLFRAIEYLAAEGLGFGELTTVEDLTTRARNDPQFLGQVKAINYFSLWQRQRTTELEEKASTTLASVENALR